MVGVPTFRDNQNNVLPTTIVLNQFEIYIEASSTKLETDASFFIVQYCSTARMILKI